MLIVAIYKILKAVVVAVATVATRLISWFSLWIPLCFCIGFLTISAVVGAPLSSVLSVFYGGLAASFFCAAVVSILLYERRKKKRLREEQQILSENERARETETEFRGGGRVKKGARGGRAAGAAHGQGGGEGIYIRMERDDYAGRGGGDGYGSDGHGGGLGKNGYGGGSDKNGYGGGYADKNGYFDKSGYKNGYGDRGSYSDKSGYSNYSDKSSYGSGSGKNTYTDKNAYSGGYANIGGYGSEDEKWAMWQQRYNQKNKAQSQRAAADETPMVFASKHDKSVYYCEYGDRLEVYVLTKRGMRLKETRWKL